MPLLKTITIATVWLAFIGLGFHVLLDYEGRPGPSSTLRQSWPPGSSLTLSPSQPYTLVMFVHPQCPCSQASISELAILTTHCQILKTYVIFLRPEGFDANWEKTPLWNRAAAIAGVTPLADLGGQESAKFNATISGETALYDQSGKLLFEGGITGSRGHEGDNLGLSTIEAIIDGKRVREAKTAVFGCALKDDQNRLNGAQRSCLR